jgi:hypothetical protein
MNTAQAKKIILRKYPSARCVKDSHGNGYLIWRGVFKYRGVIEPLSDCWMPTETQAWQAAALNLKDKP